MIGLLRERKITPCQNNRMFRNINRMLSELLKGTTSSSGPQTKPTSATTNHRKEFIISWRCLRNRANNTSKYSSIRQHHEPFHLIDNCATNAKTPNKRAFMTQQMLTSENLENHSQMKIFTTKVASEIVPKRFLRIWIVKWSRMHITIAWKRNLIKVISTCWSSLLLKLRVLFLRSITSGMARCWTSTTVLVAAKTLPKTILKSTMYYLWNDEICHILMWDKRRLICLSLLKKVRI